jgi:hypothetical protein
VEQLNSFSAFILNIFVSISVSALAMRNVWHLNKFSFDLNVFVFIASKKILSEE